MKANYMTIMKEVTSDVNQLEEQKRAGIKDLMQLTRLIIKLLK